MGEGIGKTVKLFLLWWSLYLATLIIGTILGHVFKNHEIMKWTLVAGYLLITVLFFGKGYVKLSFGHIEQHRVWPAIGMSVMMGAALVFALCSVLFLLDVDLSYQGEELEHRQQFFSGIAGALNACIFGPTIEEICFRGIVLGGLLKTRCRPWLAILISTLLFALLHGLGANFRHRHIVRNPHRLALLAHRQHHPWHHHPYHQQFTHCHRYKQSNPYLLSDYPCR